MYPPIRCSKLCHQKPRHIVNFDPVAFLRNTILFGAILGLAGCAPTPEEPPAQELVSVDVSEALERTVTDYVDFTARTTAVEAVMRDAIVPFHLWAVSIKRLPLTSIPICIASWGLAAVLSGPIVVGGLDYWLPKQKTEKKIEIMDQEDVAKKLMESR